MPPIPRHDADAPGPSTRAPEVLVDDRVEDDDIASVASSEVTEPDAEDLGVESALAGMLEEEGMDCGYMEQGYDAVRGMMDVFSACWRVAWSPGPSLVIDESMIPWTGATTGRLMVILRKPSPVGMLLNTMVDGHTGILLHAEINEGADEDSKKKYYASHGAHTSICLRLTEP